MARTVIALKGPGHITEEGVASEAITPGHLVEGVTSIAKFSTDTGPAPRNFALERDEFGKEITDNYATGDVVKIGHFRPGDRVYCLVASGSTVNKDTWLEPYSDGTLKAYSSGTRIARSLDAAGVITVLTRVRVEIY